MGLLDPTLRKVTWFGFGLAGSVIGAVRRRDGSRLRRTPDHLLVEDASGFPGPALVGPVADYDMVLLPDEIDRTQAKELGVAAGKVVLQGIAGRLRGLLAGDRLGDPAETEYAPTDAEPPSPTEPAERAAWERFVLALEKLTAMQAAHALDPDDLAAEQVRWAEVELEDAVAIAGEFEVKNIRWLLT
ncbi:MAG: hypothetical protein ACRDPE_20225 [Solirubrobacterales bacterium]